MGKEARSISLWLQLQAQERSGKTQNGTQKRQPSPQRALRHHRLLPARLGHMTLVAFLQRDLQLHRRPVHNMQIHMLCLFHTAKALRIMNLRLRSKVCCRLLPHLKQRSFHVVQVNKARDHAVHRCHVETSHHARVTRLALNRSSACKLPNEPRGCL